ncbi:MAG: hypothetical protein ACOCWC_02155 [Bacteroidota bacterium]
MKYQILSYSKNVRKYLIKAFKAISLISLSVFILYSCSPPVYHPNVVNTPLLSNKHEVNAAVNISVSGFEPQFAYALTDNLGIMANACFNKYSSEESPDYQRIILIEGGGGYFGKIGKYGRFESYGGFGYGDNFFYYDNENNPYTENVPYTKFFVQGAVGSSLDFFDAGIGPRFVWATVNDINGTYTNMYIEPVITVKVGYKYLKFVVQGGFSFPVEAASPYADARFHQPILFSFGLQANLNKIYDKTSK